MSDSEISIEEIPIAERFRLTMFGRGNIPAGITATAFKIIENHGEAAPSKYAAIPAGTPRPEWMVQVLDFISSAHSYDQYRIELEHYSLLSSAEGEIHFQNEAAGPTFVFSDESRFVLVDRDDEPSNRRTDRSQDLDEKTISFSETLVASRKELFESARARFGFDHPATLEAQADLAEAYHLSQNPGAAISTFEKVLSNRARILGGDHPDTAKARRALAHTYEAFGRNEDASDLLNHSAQMSNDSKKPSPARSRMRQEVPHVEFTVSITSEAAATLWRNLEPLRGLATELIHSTDVSEETSESIQHDLEALEKECHRSGDAVGGAIRAYTWSLEEYVRSHSDIDAELRKSQQSTDPARSTAGSAFAAALEAFDRLRDDQSDPEAAIEIAEHVAEILTAANPELDDSSATQLVLDVLGWAPGPLTLKEMADAVAVLKDNIALGAGLAVIPMVVGASPSATILTIIVGTLVSTLAESIRAVGTPLAQ